jgi:hypothetical protein
MLNQKWKGVWGLRMKIAYDIKLMKPGCALIQSVMGGSSRVKDEFSADTWLLFQTPDMHLYEVSEKQLTQLIKMTRGS